MTFIWSSFRKIQRCRVWDQKCLFWAKQDFLTQKRIPSLFCSFWTLTLCKKLEKSEFPTLNKVLLMDVGQSWIRTTLWKSQVLKKDRVITIHAARTKSRAIHFKWEDFPDKLTWCLRIRWTSNGPPIWPHYFLLSLICLRLKTEFLLKYYEHFVKLHNTIMSS